MGRKKQGNMVCEYPGCNYEIYWKYKMNRHVKSVHKKEKDLLCEVCQKTFRCNFSLNRHKRLKHKPNSQKCPKSIQNDSQQESNPVVIHFMSKKARATVTSQESFVADNENAPIQPDFEVEKSVENCVPEKHDKRFQPVLQLEKLKKVEIAMYTRKDTLQPKKSLTKFIKKSGQKNLLKENDQDMSSRAEKKPTKAEETFVSQYNYHNDYWPRQKALEAKKKTSIVKNDFAKEGVVEKQKTLLKTKKNVSKNFVKVDLAKEGIDKKLSNYKIPKYKECDIFQEPFYYQTRFYE